jgi:hypothetical protein
MTHKVKALLHLVSLGILAQPFAAQGQWIQTTQTDTMSDKSYQQFKIERTFLTPPKNPAGAPTLIVDCVPGEHRYGSGWVGGHFNRARITFGGTILSQASGGMVVNFRRDGEAKVQGQQ